MLPLVEYQDLSVERLGEFRAHWDRPLRVVRAVDIYGKSMVRLAVARGRVM